MSEYDWRIYGGPKVKTEWNGDTRATSETEDTLTVDLVYPRVTPTEQTYVEVGLECVRAADSVRLSYDYERDGWVVEQASLFQWDAGDEVCDPDWQEVAFVQAWARQVEETE